MEETFDYIESYFHHRMDAELQQEFEQRCLRDESFAADVALYISSRQVIREKLLDQKKAEWSSLEAGAAPVSSMSRRTAFLIGAAASLLLVAIVYLLARPMTSGRSAEQYIENNYGQLSATMDGSMDSLQQAILAYNNKDYVKASALFTAIGSSHPENIDAKKYAGIVYLMMRNFDKALDEFGLLAQTPGLLNNPGLFLQAVTLLERDAPGDRDRAKQLLDTVVRQQLEGNEEASAWLKKYW
jgi:hypothetical protein